MLSRTFVVCFLTSLMGCGGSTANSSGTISQQGVVFTQDQRLIADQIISVFENDTPDIQYGYAENLKDGRGITAGRAGFTSATGDMLEVVSNYTDLHPGNPLSVYLPRLGELAATESDSTVGLENFETVWQAEAAQLDFREVQDDIVDDVYYLPATVQAKQLGASLPLTLLNLYDAIIQHGEGDDPDGLPAMIERTTAEVGGTPADGADEKTWLLAFMTIRRSVLLDPFNHATQKEWSESVGRVDALIDLYEQAKFSLAPPLVIAPWGDAHTLPEN